MKPTENFVKRTRIEAPAELVMAWHARPGALERILPPWEKLRIVEWNRDLRDGARAVFTVSIAGIPRTWVADHFGYIEGRQFCDVQPKGPFAYWHYVHKADPDGPNACYYEDNIEYQLPFGALGSMLGGRYVRERLERIYAYRHATVKHDSQLHAQFSRQPLRILVTGASGMLGSRLVHFLSAGGHSVGILTRGTAPTYAKVVAWNPQQGILPREQLEGFDAIVHLDGLRETASVGLRRAERLKSERTLSTQLLCETLARLDTPPGVLICGSSTAFYGDRGETELSEADRPGNGSLSGLARAREELAEPLSAHGIRVAHLRFGTVLTSAGGMLRRRLLARRLGFSYELGDGARYRSWVSLDDAMGAILHVIGRTDISGPVNVTAPNPVSEREFGSLLANALGRSLPLHFPAALLRGFMGDGGEEAILASARVQPARLLAADYDFRHPDLDVALRHLLGISERLPNEAVAGAY
jgi:uncharacterized protein